MFLIPSIMLSHSTLTFCIIYFQTRPKTVTPFFGLSENGVPRKPSSSPNHIVGFIFHCILLYQILLYHTHLKISCCQIYVPCIFYAYHYWLSYRPNSPHYILMFRYQTHLGIIFHIPSQWVKLIPILFPFSP